jgi:hypothetical protein
MVVYLAVSRCFISCRQDETFAGGQHSKVIKKQNRNTEIHREEKTSEDTGGREGNKLLKTRRSSTSKLHYPVSPLGRPARNK